MDERMKEDDFCGRRSFLAGSFGEVVVSVGLENAFDTLERPA